MSVMSSDRKSRSSNSTESTLEKNKLTSLTPFRSAAREVIVPLQHRNVLSLQMAVFFIALYIKQQSTMSVFNCFLCFLAFLVYCRCSCGVRPNRVRACF